MKTSKRVQFPLIHSDENAPHLTDEQVEQALLKDEQELAEYSSQFANDKNCNTDSCNAPSKKHKTKV